MKDLMLMMKKFVLYLLVDLDQFNLQKNNYDKNINLILGYHGSVGTWYEFDKVLIFYKK